MEVIIRENYDEMSKQAAQKRFVPRSSLEVPELGNWSRFTDRARRALASAQRLAGAAQFEEVQPGHILLGLLADPEGVAARVLAAQAPLDRIGAAVTTTLGALLFVWAVWLLATDDPDGGRHPAGTVMLVVAVLLGGLGVVSLRRSRS